MRLSSSLRTSRRSAILMGASLAFGAATRAGAQDNGTPEADSELVSETAAQLPAADLPSMNAQGFVFEVESTFDGMFNELPTEAPVYIMEQPVIDLERAQSIASNLGIEGDVVEQGEGTFDAQGENGTLFVVPGMMQYISNAEVPEGELPNDEEAVAFSREWLRQVNMLPGDVGEGRVQTRIENPPRVIVSFQPVRPAPLLSASPNIRVTLGPEGAVLEAANQWATLTEGELYQLRGTEAAWAEVEGRRAFLETILPQDSFEAGSTITGQATYSEVSLAYTTSGIPGERQYLQPVYVFRGTLEPEGAEDGYAITSYVPALINSQQPVG